jgi:Transglutaminase-like superfamily
VPRTLIDLQRAAERAGCTLVRVEQVGGLLRGYFDCPDVEDGLPYATAKFLQELAQGDASADPFPRALLRELGKDRATAGPRIQAYAQSRVRFTPEEIETFITPTALVRMGAGDCDDSSRLVVSLARAVGLPARFVYFVQDGQPAHVTAQICDGRKWRWAEATIAARYDEHPFAAMKRLGLKRADLDGAAVVLDNGQARPMMGALRGVQTMGSLEGAPASLGASFDTTLIAWAKTIGADPLGIVKLLLSESGLNPSATNSSGFAAGQYAVGINQLAPVNWGYFSPMSAAQYAGLTAEAQLPYVFAYWGNVMKGAGISTASAADLYWLNFLPATFVKDATDEHVIVSSSSGYYTNNAGLDHGSKGYITKGDLQKSLDAQPANYPALWATISQAIYQDQGGVTRGEAVAVLAVAALAGLALGKILT